MRRTTCGFTLLELMTTLAIAGILLGLGIPAFSRVLEAIRAQGALSGTTTALAMARGLAVTRHQAASVCPSRDQVTCRTDGIWDDGWIVFLDPQRSGQPLGPEAVIRRFDPPSHLHLHATAGRPLVRFQGSGTAYGSNVTLRLCSVDRLIGAIVVNNTGRARSIHEKSTTACPYQLD